MIITFIKIGQTQQGYLVQAVMIVDMNRSGVRNRKIYNVWYRVRYFTVNSLKLRNSPETESGKASASGQSICMRMCRKHGI